MKNIKMTTGCSANLFLNTKTKFNIGQKVKAYGTKQKGIICPFCNGKYEKEVEGDTFYCANCDEGVMKLESESILVDATITGIYVDVRKGKVNEDDMNDYTYADEYGYKDIEYVLDADDEDVNICMTNEKKLSEWNE